MAKASDAQVQAFSNNRIRRRVEQMRALYLECLNDRESIDDVYENVNAGDATYVDDGREDAPQKATKQDVLAYNSAAAMIVAFFEGTLTDQNKNDFGHPQAGLWPIMRGLCVRDIGV